MQQRANLKQGRQDMDQNFDTPTTSCKEKSAQTFVDVVVSMRPSTLPHSDNSCLPDPK
jgi:hypothetical protein